MNNKIQEVLTDRKIKPICFGGEPWEGCKECVSEQKCKNKRIEQLESIKP